MSLIKQLEQIADKYDLGYKSIIASMYFKGIQLIVFVLLMLTIFNPNITNIFTAFFCVTILSMIGASTIVCSDHQIIFSFKEDLIIWKFLLSSPKKQQAIKEELKAYLDAKYEPEIDVNKKTFMDIPALQEDNLKLAEWVAKYVRKETSVVNHFVSRYGNPLIKDMHFIRLLIWSQLIPIKKFDLNDLRMTLAANPDIDHEVIKANQTPELSQEDLSKIFANYSSQDLLILLTGDFSVELYLNVLRRAFDLKLELPVMKSVRDLVKHIHYMSEKDFVVKDWHKTITDNNSFEFIEAITTKEILVMHRSYFKNCILTYSRRMGEGQGMLFVAYKQGFPHIVFYVDSDLKLGDATYRFNHKISQDDRKILLEMCLAAKASHK